MGLRERFAFLGSCFATPFGNCSCVAAASNAAGVATHPTSAYGGATPPTPREGNSNRESGAVMRRSQTATEQLEVGSTLAECCGAALGVG